MEVFVKSAQGQAMESEDSLAAKAFLNEKVGEAAQLQLLHQGSNLGNDSALASCNMGDGGTLQLSMARRAGAAQPQPGTHGLNRIPCRAPSGG